MLTREQTVLLIVDVQGKLAHGMHEQQLLFENLQRLVRGAQILQIPVVVTEQNPAGLGPTIPELAQLLMDVQPISKHSFSCCGNQQFMRTLVDMRRTQVLLAGIETHICVYQTTLDLLKQGYEVQVVADAVSSRTALNKSVGLERMRSSGAMLTSTEMALYELLQIAEGSMFKQILAIVK